MTKEPLTSIIIVNYNGGEIFRNCIKSLDKITYQNYELIIIDNDSTDHPETQIDKSFKKNYTLIKNEKNLGFAPANNQGVKIAKGKYILLLNNDTLVPADFLTIMVKKMESDKKIGAMQPKIYLMDKKNYLDNSGTFINKLGLLEHWGFGKKDNIEFNNEREIFSAKGACLLTTKNLINKIGLFDDEFVSYYEETDFCHRVWLAGYKVIYSPDTHIFHKLGMTSKKLNPITTNYHSIKNRLCSLIKNLEVHNLFTILFLHILMLKAIMFYYLIKLQFGKANMIFHALVWNLLNINSTFQKRREIQKFRVISDKEIFARVGSPINIVKLLNHFQKVEANFK